MLDAHAAAYAPASTTWSARPASCAVAATGVTVLPAEGFVGAIYVHEMARSGDPHLHAHLVIANRVKGPDGRWSAPDMRPVYAQAKTAGTIADAVMRDELTRSLGVEWGPVINGIAELVAVPRRCASTSRPVTPRSWRRRPPAGSPRCRASPPSSARRATERGSIARGEAAAGWRARAAEHGFGEHELRRALGRARGSRPPTTPSACARRPRTCSAPGA